MLDLLSLTVILPLLGAGGIALLSLLYARVNVKRGYGGAAFALLPVATVLVAAIIVVTSGAGARVSLSSLYPSALAESLVELRWDSVLWPLGLALSVSTGALLLAAGGQRRRSAHDAATVLVLLAAGLAALWSGNPLTTIVCWSVYDFALVLGWIVLGGERRESLRVLIPGTVAVLLLWAGVIVAGGGIGSVPWPLMPAGGGQAAIWMLAGLFRIGAYPLHVWVPRTMREVSPLSAAVLLSPLLGWGLWVRLAVVGEANLPIRSWMVVPAVLTLFAGGLLAWTADSIRQSRRWIGLGVNGSVLLATVVTFVGREADGSNLVVPGMMLGAVGWTLGMTLLFVGEGLSLGGGQGGGVRLRSVPSIIGAFSLIGVPATAGFAGVSLVMSDQARAGGYGLIVGVFLGQLLLGASVIRWLMGTGSATEMGRGRLSRVAQWAAMGCLCISIIVVGIMPGRLVSGLGSSPGASVDSLLAAPSLSGWLVWVGATLLGVGAAWLDRGFRARMSLWLMAVHDAISLDWAYGLLVGAMEQGFRLIRVVDAILGGRAAIIWSSVILLIFLLMGDW